MMGLLLWQIAPMKMLGFTTISKISLFSISEILNHSLHTELNSPVSNQVPTLDWDFLNTL